MRLPLIALLVLLSACSPDESAGPKREGGPPAAVTVVSVMPKSWSEVIDAVGTAKARESVVIAAKQSGRIAAVRFESGQRVGKGQVLVELDSGAARRLVQDANWPSASADGQYVYYHGSSAGASFVGRVAMPKRARPKRATKGVSIACPSARLAK